MQSSTNPAFSTSPAPSKKSSSLNPEIIQSLTPIILAAFGCLIGGIALLPGIGSDKATSALALAGNAFAGAAGLAKSESSFSARKRGDDVEIDVPGTRKSE